MTATEVIAGIESDLAQRLTAPRFDHHELWTFLAELKEAISDYESRYGAIESQGVPSRRTYYSYFRFLYAFLMKSGPGSSTQKDAIQELHHMIKRLQDCLFDLRYEVRHGAP